MNGWDQQPKDDFLGGPAYGSYDWSGASGSSKGWKAYTSCFESHPPYPVAPGLVIYGGSCSRPVVKDADLYVGFDWGMKLSKRSLPWEPGEEFLYEISDMHAPKDIGSFMKLIEYLAAALQAGKKVHCGCIGGHGRTGTVLAALHKHMTGDPNAIVHVRENYCKKAVESQEQIDFLQKHFEIIPAAPTKAYGSSHGPGKKKIKQGSLELLKTRTSESQTETVRAMHDVAGSIWKPWA